MAFFSATNSIRGRGREEGFSEEKGESSIDRLSVGENGLGFDDTGCMVNAFLEQGSRGVGKTRGYGWRYWRRDLLRERNSHKINGANA